MKGEKKRSILPVYVCASKRVGVQVSLREIVSASVCLRM